MRKLKNNSAATPGSAGSQGGFLGECWALARSGASGAHGSAGSQTGTGTSTTAAERSCAPERSRQGLERGSAGPTASYDERSRDPEGTEEELLKWERRAARLLAGIERPDLRSDLRDVFEERLAICLADDLPMAHSGRTAFVELVSAARSAGIPVADDGDGASPHGGAT